MSENEIHITEIQFHKSKNEFYMTEIEFHKSENEFLKSEVGMEKVYIFSMATSDFRNSFSDL